MKDNELYDLMKYESDESKKEFLKFYAYKLITRGFSKKEILDKLSKVKTIINGGTTNG